MAKEKLEYKLRYPEFSARNYAVAIDNPHSKPMVDPVSFFMARWFLTNPEDTKHKGRTVRGLKSILRDWIRQE